VVAVTKIDRPNADVEHVLQQLAQHELIPESWGGDVQVVPVAATQGKGIDELLDAILVQAEVMELKARREGPAKGVVIEAWLDPGRGALASILVQQGTLHQGDWLLAGTETGRVRQLMNEQGQPIKEVGPSLPALVAGLSGVPDAGVSAMVVRDEATAREVAQAREARLREERLSERKTPDAQSAMERLLGNQQGNKVLRYLIKADSKGTAEALRHAVAAMGNAEVHVEVVSAGVGMVSSSDVELAHTTGATIIAFNTRPDAASRKQLQEQHVPMMTHKIIYEVLEDVEAQVKGQMAPVVREHVIGHAQVREIFESSKMGKVAGCLVTEGVVRRNSPIRVLRRHVVVFEGKLESLRRFKENVEEVRSGVECGIAVRDYEDVRPGDEIEVFERIVEQPGAA
jgi:translation initiation factor IF-2